MIKTCKIRKYHSAVWNNPIIMELGTPGERGVLVPLAERDVEQKVGKAADLVPANMLRQDPPKLPEVSQPQVIRHYEQLSQQTLGMEINTAVERSLTTKAQKDSIRLLFFYYPCNEVFRYRNEIDLVGKILRCLDCCDIGINQNCLDALLF